LTQDPQIPLSTALPLLLLGMPIIDTLMVMIERLLNGSSPFLADRRHIHHRLLALGFEHWEAVSILYVLQGCLLIVAWFMRYDSDLWVAASFVGFALLVVVPIRVAQRLGWRARRTSRTPVDPTTSIRRAQQDAGATRSILASIRSIGSTLLRLVLASYAVWVLTIGGRLSHDVQMLALGLAAMLAAGLMLRWRQAEAGWIDKAALYSCAALAIFVTKHGLPWALSLSGNATHPSLVEYILYVALAMALVISIRGSPNGPFKITPLDLLVLLVVVTVPNLPDSVASARSLGVTIAELALLFYSVEALSLATGSSWRWLSGGAAVFLLGLALRPGL
jgi:UDP-GlcNAc:undecaprenyl-phosphate GlcNAc-1-phosphate transferase